MLTALVLTSLLAPAPLDDPAGADLTVLRAAGAAASARAGSALAVSGDVAVVGAPESGSGRVAIYERSVSGGAFAPFHQRTSPDGRNGDRFGAALALDGPGGVLLVGAPGDDDTAAGSGAAYLFLRVTGGWSLLDKIKASDPGGGDAFGSSVALYRVSAFETRLLIGAPDDGHSGASAAGSAYAYRFDGSAIHFEAKLTAPTPGSFAHFGSAVALAKNAGGSWGFVGSPDDSLFANRCGAVYGFLRSGVTWSHATTEGPGVPDAFLEFGASLSAVESYVLIGAPGHDGAAGNAGGAYVFKRLATQYTQDGLFLGPAIFGAAFGSTVALHHTGTEYRMLMGAPNVGLAYAVEGTGSPWAVPAPLLPAGGATGTRFGAAVARSGDDAWIGAPLDSEAEQEAGAAYAFDESSGSWSSTKVLPANESRGNQFGVSVAADGDLLVAGASAEDGTGNNSGAAYVWERAAGAWTQLARLTADTFAGAQFRFGASVAVLGDTIAVGAPNEGLAGNGRVFIFRRSGTQWPLEATRSGIVAQAELGVSVDLEDDRLAAGAPGLNGYGGVFIFERSGTTWDAGVAVFHPFQQLDSDFGLAVAVEGTTLVVGAPDDDTFLDRAGAAHVYARSGNVWNLVQVLSPPAPGPTIGGRFARALALDGEWLAIGETENDLAGFNAGAVHVYRKNVTTFTYHSTLPSSVTTGNDDFGTSVSIDGPTLLVGQPVDDPIAAGTAQLFRWTGTAWTFAGSLPATTFEEEGVRGSSTALVGDSSFLGVPGASEFAGTVEVYDVPEGPLLYCTGKTSSLGCVPFISVSGTASATDTQPFTIAAHDLVPDEPGFLLYAFAKTNLGFHGGKLCVKAPFRRLLPPKAAQSTGVPPCTGFLKRNFQNRIQGGADPLLTVGQRVFAQWRTRDPADPAGFGDGLTNAVRFTVCP